MALGRLYYGGDLLRLTDYSILQRVSDVYGLSFASMASSPSSLFFLRLPFGQESSTALGLIAKARLENPSANLAARFPNCANIQGDLRYAHTLWTQALHLLFLVCVYIFSFSCFRFSRRWRRSSHFMPTSLSTMRCGLTSLPRTTSSMSASRKASSCSSKSKNQNKRRREGKRNNVGEVISRRLEQIHRCSR